MQPSRFRFEREGWQIYVMGQIRYQDEGGAAWEANRQSRPSTLGRRVAAIRYAHKLAAHPVPTDDERVRATMRGIRRSVGTAPIRKSPATAELIMAMAPVRAFHGLLPSARRRWAFPRSNAI